MPGLLSRIWKAIKNEQGPAAYGARMYESARQSRLSADWGSVSDSSADSELVSSLRALRSRSRALCRDVSYAKRARTLVVNNIIGPGIGMQAQVYTTRDELSSRANDDIETQWAKWSRADSCHVGGRMTFSAIERALIGEVFEAGEVLVRKHYRTFGSSAVPFALEIVEPERLVDDYMSPFLVAENGNEIRMGVEVDTYGRPVAYYLRKRHPGELRFTSPQPDEIERVPAELIIHLAVVDRWPQTRGEPWLSPVIRTFRDMSGYIEAEITRARIQASPPWAIETPEASTSFGEERTDGSVEMSVEPGVAKRLNPGEKLNAPPVNSPNPQVEPFMRYMLRNLAAGIGVSYESLSKDYSQSNYSSSRLALLDDRDLWRVLQSWFISSFREPIHREWMQQAVMAQAFKSFSVDEWAYNREKFESVRFRPRGWGWVDPTKEVEAFKEAVRCGFMTLQDVVAQSGADIEEIYEQRAKEVEMAEEYDLVLDTDPANEIKVAEASQPADPPDEEPEDPAEEPPEEPATRRVFSLAR